MQGQGPGAGEEDLSNVFGYVDSADTVSNTVSNSALSRPYTRRGVFEEARESVQRRMGLHAVVPPDDADASEAGAAPTLTSHFEAGIGECTLEKYIAECVSANTRRHFPKITDERARAVAELMLKAKQAEQLHGVTKRLLQTVDERMKDMLGDETFKELVHSPHMAHLRQMRIVLAERADKLETKAKGARKGAARGQHASARAPVEPRGLRGLQQGAVPAASPPAAAVPAASPPPAAPATRSKPLWLLNDEAQGRSLPTPTPEELAKEKQLQEQKRRQQQEQQERQKLQQQ